MALYTDHVARHPGDWGIVGLGLLPDDAVMAAVLRRQDHLYTLIEKGPGEPTAAVIGSLVDYVHAPDDDGTLDAVVAADSTSILSLTVTEAGYVEPTPDQLAAGTPTTFDRLAAALRVRRDRGSGGLTVLSCDNVPGNGEVARTAMLAAAERIDRRLAAWVEEACSFPSSMVDRITPVTSEADRAWLRDAHGVDDGWPVVAEPFRQWVLEDTFVAGRPAWELDGALFTSDVHDWELYKLRLLNAGHSGMAYLCSLAGLTFVDESMTVPQVRAFVETLLRIEALPTLTEIPGHPREQYVASVLERFDNPGVRDQVARLCIDGSAKFPTFLIPTIVSQLKQGGPVERAATALAGWARYLAVTEDGAQAFDAIGHTARRYARAAMSDPRAFLDYAEVFPPAIRDSPRFVESFADAYVAVAEQGPLTAMARAADLVGGVAAR